MSADKQIETGRETCDEQCYSYFHEHGMPLAVRRSYLSIIIRIYYLFILAGARDDREKSEENMKQ
jgi:hypothetical protein